MTEDEWNAKPQVKMGDFGQNLIFEFLNKQGMECYKPAFTGRHRIDWMGFSVKHFLGYSGPLSIEAKAKPRRRHYPDTGVDIHLLERYKQVASFMPVLMCFCDSLQKYIYGNFLHILERPLNQVDEQYVFYPEEYRGKRYWHLSSMVPFRALTDDEIEELEKHQTRSADYEAIVPKWYAFSNPGLMHNPRF